MFPHCNAKTPDKPRLLRSMPLEVFTCLQGGNPISGSLAPSAFRRSWRFAPRADYPLCGSFCGLRRCYRDFPLARLVKRTFLALRPINSFHLGPPGVLRAFRALHPLKVRCLRHWREPVPLLHLRPTGLYTVCESVTVAGPFLSCRLALANGGFKGLCLANPAPGQVRTFALMV